MPVGLFHGCFFWDLGAFFGTLLGALLGTPAVAFFGTAVALGRTSWCLLRRTSLRWTALNFALFPSPAANFIIFFSLWGSSRGVVVAIQGRGPPEVRVWAPWGHFVTPGGLHEIRVAVAQFLSHVDVVFCRVLQLGRCDTGSAVQTQTKLAHSRRCVLVCIGLLFLSLCRLLFPICLT